MSEDQLIAQVVGTLDADTVRYLLIAAAGQHESVATAVRLAAASPADRLAALRVLVDDDLRTRRFLGYRQSIDWANDAAPVVEALSAEADVSPSRELLVLVERAVSHVVKVILKADDSAGTIGDLASDLLGIHGRLCDSGVADPAALARWMVKFGCDDQDFFTVDPVRYSDALGDHGVQLFRAAIEKRPHTRENEFAVKYAIQRLAILDGDAKRLVELLGGDLSSPHQFIRVAEAMLELQRPDDAVSWARRGIESTTGWQVAQLYEILARDLAGSGHTADLLDLRREHHTRMASASTYSSLRQAAIANDAWPAEVEAARSILGARDRGALIDVLLADGEIESAWQLATSDNDWYAGDQRWAVLAEAREATNPAASLGAYMRLVESALRTADKNAYRAAVGYLKRARRAANAAELSADLDEYISSLRELHRRRPTLIQMLDKAGMR